MVGVVSIKIEKECAREARGQKLPKDENPIDRGRRSSDRKRQLGFDEVIKATSAQGEVLFCHDCGQWQSESDFANIRQIERDNKQIDRAQTKGVQGTEAQQ
jgi:hypothetical protein